MVTAEEIGAVKILGDLEPGSRERLARVAADISLMPGEYAADQGAERALFALLEGRIEVVSMVDGVERVVGERGPGDIIGEVPITLGTVFPVGFRAAEKSRVMRVEPHDYHAVAAVEPEIAQQIGRLASERMSGSGGLQASRQIRRRPARSCWDTARTPPAPSCAASSTTTRSRSSGSRRMRRMPPSVGTGPCRPRTISRPFAWSTARRWCGRRLRRLAELLGLGTEAGAAS